MRRVLVAGMASIGLFLTISGCKTVTPAEQAQIQALQLQTSTMRIKSMGYAGHGQGSSPEPSTTIIVVPGQAQPYAEAPYGIRTYYWPY